MWLSAFSLFIILVSCTRCTANKIIRNEKDSWTFLNKYGYNPCFNSSTKVLCSVDYSSMLRNFQQRHGLEMTGTLDAPTINQMDQPRCGNADVLAMKLSDFKWSRSSLTWSLRSHPRQISRARTSTIIQEAFNAWTTHIPFQIKETCSTCKSDFVVETGRYGHNCNGGSFDGASGTLAHAFFPQDGRIHFDADEPWTEAFDGSGVNFYLVAVHEIGHALGLDHNHNRKSIMYPSYSLFPRGSMLPDYDRQNIQTMYGASKGGGGTDAGGGTGAGGGTKPNFDSKSYYRLTTKWQGDGKSLDIVNDGKNNRPILSKTGGYSGQYWKITSVSGNYYRLTTQWQGDDKSLDIVNDGTNNRPILSKTGGYSGQYWKITSVGGDYYRLTTKWQGDDKSLDILNDGTNNRPILSKTGGYSGQYWKIIKV